MNELEHRIMGNQPIASSFKGILRLSPVIDGEGPYDFLVEKYFKNFNSSFKDADSVITSENVKLNFADGAYNDTTKALNGELKRYSSEDVFYNGKLPVTDSIGTYVNINMGLDGTVFGSIEDSKNNNDFRNGFPIIEANNLVVGLEKIRPNETKELANGGKLNIMANPHTGKQAQIVTECNISQSEISETAQTNYSTTIGGPYKTVMTTGNKEANEYDAFVYNQEWYEKNNDEPIISTVKIRNLEEIVKERLEKYLQNSVVEMPTGSVIWQYVNLKKWYASDDTGEEIEYSGARPKLMNPGKNSPVDDKYVFYSSKIQGVTKKINRLLDSKSNRYVYDDGTTETIDVKEIVPLYKRDYVLCDGTVYEIPAALNEDVADAVIETRDYASYNRFKDLFSTIGYYYTEPKNLKNHYCYKETSGGRREFWTTNEEDHPSDKKIDGVFLIDDELKNQEVMFGRDYCMLLAFYYIHKEILNETFVDDNKTKTFDRTKAENWLKSKELNKEHLFTTPTSDSNQLYYEQKVNGASESETFKINLGTEVNSFSSKIALNESNGIIEMCEVWQLPEVQYILDMFDNYRGAASTTGKYFTDKNNGEAIIMTEMSRAMKKYCSCYFQVPNFNVFEEQKYKMGSFMCSSATMLFSEQDVFEQSKSNCYFTANELPHRHSLFIGWNEYGTANPECGQVPPKLNSIYGSSSRCSAYGIFKNNGNTPGVSCSDSLNNYVVQFDRGVKKKLISKDDFPASAYNVLNKNNMYYCEIMVKGDHIAEPDRGITSDQVNETTLDIDKVEAAKNANLIEGSAEFFAPESINMLPLIKL